MSNETQKLKWHLHNKLIYLFNKENDTWRTQLHEGTPTMAPKNMYKQAEVINTNQIQSKAQQPDMILNHRDLGIWLEIWLGWHKTWAKLFIWVHWNNTGRRVVHGKNDCWAFSIFISPSWELVTDLRLRVARKCLAILVHGWWSSSGVEWSKPLSCCLLWLGGVNSPSVFFHGFT